MIWLKNFTKLDNNDILATYRARTDELTLKVSGARDISFDDFREFVRNLAFSKSKLYFMVFSDDDFIGVIDFININLASAEFGVYKNPNAKKAGDILMKEMLNYAENNLNVNFLTARVKEDNKKAIKLFEKYGFTTYEMDGDMIYMKKFINEAENEK